MRKLPQVAGLMLIAASAIVFSSPDRSGSRELADRVMRLDRVPMEIGEWSGRPMTLDRRAVELGEIAGYLLRRYENYRGDGVALLIVCGRPGPIAVHTPEVCYGGAGYEPVGPRARLSIGPGDEAWSLDLARNGSVATDRLRILYAWNADGPWRAADQPRLQFTSAAALYKVYIVQDVSGGDVPDREDLLRRFALELLPEVREALFPAG